MALLLRPKYLLVYKKNKGRAQTDRRREEEKKRREEKRREEEEEEKRRRKKEEEFKEDSKVLNLTFSMDYLDFLYGYMFWFVGCKKPNPRMNSCMESRVWNPPFEVGIMV